MTDHTSPTPPTAQYLRTLVKTYYDFQGMRIRSANRLKKKRDGSDQAAIDEVTTDVSLIPALVDAWQDAQDTEDKLLKQISALLPSFPIWNEFLSQVKGIGPLMGAVIISEYDIHKATTVSKMWQYTGLNPGMVPGNKPTGSKKDGTFQVVKSDVLVRGDKLTPGFLSPFNTFLRTKMVGVLAASFIKSSSPYRTYYDNYKHRLENSSRIITGSSTKWKDTTKGHRSNAAKRYMIKMFLRDLYIAWRTLEDLPVRPPYEEEYLGKVHSAEGALT